MIAATGAESVFTPTSNPTTRTGKLLVPLRYASWSNVRARQIQSIIIRINRSTSINKDLLVVKVDSSLELDYSNVIVEVSWIVLWMNDD